MEYVISMALASACGIIGYAFLARASLRSMLPSLVLGLCGTAVYFACINNHFSSFLSNMLAALLISVGAEICAHLFRAPVPVFLFPGVITLVPGALLYRSMTGLMNAEYMAALDYLLETLRVCGGIVNGMICGIIFTSSFRSVLRAKHNKKKNKRKNPGSDKSGISRSVGGQ